MNGGKQPDERAERGERIEPGGNAGQAAQASPLEAGAGDQERDQRRPPRPRQQEKRCEETDDQRRGGGDSCSERALQATSARLDSDTCSLVRPKRRSRLRYDAIASSSAAASKSGHSVSVK